MAFEVRYVGNRNTQRLDDRELEREETLFENGFIDEFKARAGEPRAPRRAGLRRDRRCTFAYRGPGTGTSPLPTYLAYFSGAERGAGRRRGATSSANFRNTAWTGHLG